MRGDQRACRNQSNSGPTGQASAQNLPRTARRPVHPAGCSRSARTRRCFPRWVLVERPVSPAGNRRIGLMREAGRRGVNEGAGHDLGRLQFHAGIQCQLPGGRLLLRTQEGLRGRSPGSDRQAHPDRRLVQQFRGKSTAHAALPRHHGGRHPRMDTASRRAGRSGPAGSAAGLPEELAGLGAVPRVGTARRGPRPADLADGVRHQ